MVTIQEVLFENKIWTSWDSVFDCIICIVSLFTSSPDVGHDFQIVSGTIFTTEAAGHLGLNFYHPDITFGLIVIEWNHEVMDKKADCCLVIIKTLHQSKNLSFFFRPRFFSATTGRGFSSLACLISSSYRLSNLWWW